MNSKNRSYFKNTNQVKDNISGWVLTTSFGASIISGMLIGLVVENFIETIEWLYLAAKGHRRALFTLKNNSLEKKWLIP